MAARKRTTARAAVLPARRGLPDARRLMPSGKSVLAGLALFVLALGAYFGARDTSVFAVRSLDVRGGTPALRAQVRAALADELGKSLVAVDGSALDHSVAAIPGVRSFTYDRSFPHTLRVVVDREVPVLVVRRVPGSDAFLVGASGKVIRMLTNSRLSHLPRIWVTKDAQVVVGQNLPAALAGAATALGALRGSSLPGGVRTIQVGRDELTLTLGGGVEVRLGDAGDVRLKLGIARRILRATGAATSGSGYVDVSVPERPVLCCTTTNSQVEG